MRWDFIPGHLAPRPPPPSSPEPAGMGNAIEEEGRSWACQGPCSADDFYYDYNFINFHEDLSYGPFKTLTPDLVGTGDWRPPPPSTAAEPPRGPPSLPQSLLGLRMRGHWEMGPHPFTQPGWPIPTLYPQSRPLGTPGSNFLPEEDAPIGAPDLGLPSLPWPPLASMEAPAAPGSQNQFLGAEGQPEPAARLLVERTNEVSDDEEALGH